MSDWLDGYLDAAERRRREEEERRKKELEAKAPAPSDWLDAVLSTAPAAPKPSAPAQEFLQLQKERAEAMRAKGALPQEQIETGPPQAGLFGRVAGGIGSAYSGAVEAALGAGMMVSENPWLAGPVSGVAAMLRPEEHTAKQQEILREQIETQRAWRESMPQPEGFLESLPGMVHGSLPYMLNPLAGGTMMVGGEYQARRDAGASPGAAATVALPVGIAQQGLETLGGKAVFGKAKIGGAPQPAAPLGVARELLNGQRLQDMGATMLKTADTTAKRAVARSLDLAGRSLFEASTEAAQTVLGAAGEIVSGKSEERREMGAGERALAVGQELPAQMWEAWKGGLAVGAVLSGASIVDEAGYLRKKSVNATPTAAEMHGVEVTSDPALARTAADEIEQVMSIFARNGATHEDLAPLKEEIATLRNIARGPEPAPSSAPPSPSVPGVEPSLIERPVPLEPGKAPKWIAAVGAVDHGRVVGRDEQQPFQWVVAKGNDVVSSHDTAFHKREAYPKELQARNLELSNQEFILRQSRDVHPDELLANPHLANGAPIVGPDGSLESGNHRDNILNQMYELAEQGSPEHVRSRDRYIEAIKAHAEAVGIDPATIVPEDRPKLLRYRLTQIAPGERARWADDLNRSATQAKNAAEAGVADALRLSDGHLDLMDPNADLNSAQNADFRKAFLYDIIGPTERGLAVDRNGVPTPEFTARMESAVLARAYPDRDLMQRLMTDATGMQRRIVGALVGAAPRVARLRRDLEQGTRQHPMPDPSAPIVEAAARLDELAKNGENGSLGTKLDRYLQSATLFEVSEQEAVAREFLAIIAADPELRSANKSKKFQHFVSTYFDLADSLNPPVPRESVDLFGQVHLDGEVMPPPPQGADLVRMAYQQHQAALEAEASAQQDLFDAPSKEIVAPQGVEVRGEGWVRGINGAEVRLQGSEVALRTPEGQWHTMSRGAFNESSAAAPYRELADFAEQTVDSDVGKAASRLRLGAQLETLRGIYTAATDQGTADAIVALWGARAQQWSDLTGRPPEQMAQEHQILLPADPSKPGSPPAPLPGVVYNDAAFSSFDAFRSADLDAAGKTKRDTSLTSLRIQPGQSKAEARNTILHETVHAWEATMVPSEIEALRRVTTDVLGREPTSVEQSEMFVEMVEAALISSSVARVASHVGDAAVISGALVHLRDTAAQVWHQAKGRRKAGVRSASIAAGRAQVESVLGAGLAPRGTVPDPAPPAPTPYTIALDLVADRRTGKIDMDTYREQMAALVAYESETQLNQAQGSPAGAVLQYLATAGGEPVLSEAAFSHWLGTGQGRLFEADPATRELAMVGWEMFRLTQQRRSHAERLGHQAKDVPVASADGAANVDPGQALAAGATPGTALVGPDMAAATYTPANKMPWWRKFAAKFRARGVVPQAVWERYQQAARTESSDMLNAERNAARFTMELERVAGAKGIRPEVMREAIMMALTTGSLTPDSTFRDMPLFEATKAMRADIDRFTETMLSMPDMLTPQLAEVLAANRGTYMRRVYRANKAPDWAERIENTPEWNRAATWVYHNALVRPDIMEISEEARWEAAHAALRAWVQSGSWSAFGVMADGKGANQSLFKHRGDVVKDLRAVLGEERSPEMAYLESVRSMTSAVNRYQMFQWMRDQGEGFFVSSHPTADHMVAIDGEHLRPLSGQATAVLYDRRVPERFEPVEIHPAYAHEIDATIPGDGRFVVLDWHRSDGPPDPSGNGAVGDYVKVQDTRSKKQFHLAPHQLKLVADGAEVTLGEEQARVRPGTPPVYTSPEVAEWLQGERKGSGDLHTLFAAYIALNGAVKAGKVVISPVTQARNFLSNSSIALSNGMITPSGLARMLRGEHKGDIYAMLSGKVENVAQLSQWAVWAAKDGALSPGATAADMVAYMEMTEGGLANLDPASTVAKAGRAANKMFAKAARLYQAGDNFWKLHGYIHKAHQLAWANGRSEPNAADRAEAGRRVNVGYPSIENVPPAIDTLRKIPFIGTFPSFHWLATGALVRTFQQATADMRHENPRMRSLGRRQMLGWLTAVTAPTAVPLMLAALRGMSDDDEDEAAMGLLGRFGVATKDAWQQGAAVRHFVPEWSRHSDVYLLGLDKSKGTVRWSDASWSDPFNAARRPVLVLLRRALGGDVSEQEWTDTIAAAIDQLLAPYTDMEITAQTAVSLVSNRRVGRTSGGEIYNPLDTGTAKLGSIAEYVARQLGPGVNTQLMDLMAWWSGEPVGGTGRIVTGKDMLAGMVGIKTNTLDIPRELARAAWTYREQEQYARQLYTRARFGGTAAGNLAALEQAQEASRELWGHMQGHVEAARRSGLTDTQILKAFTEPSQRPRRVGAELVFDDELEDRVQRLTALGVPPEQIYGAMTDTGGGKRAPFTEPFALRLLMNDWQPMTFR